MGKFGSSYQQLGRDIQAHGHRIGLNGLGPVLEAAAHGAEIIRKTVTEDTPGDRVWKIEKESLIDSETAKLAVQYKADPNKFTEEVEKLQAKLADDVTAKHNDWFAETFNKKKAGYLHTLEINAAEVERGREFEKLHNYGEELRAKAMHYASQGNQQAYNDYLAKWQENTNFMYDNQFITPQQKVYMADNFIQEGLVQLNTGFAKKSFGDVNKLNAILKKIDNTSTYTPEQKTSIKNNIKAEYNTWLATQKVANKELSDNADFGIKAYNAGIEPEGFDVAEMVNSLIAKGLNTKAVELKKAYDDRQMYKTFSGMNLVQMQETLREAKNSVKNKDDLARIKNLQSIFDNAEKNIKDDALTFAIDHGVIKDQGLDFNNPESVANRLNNAKVLKEKYNLKDAPVMTKAETSFYNQIISNGNPATKVKILNAFKNTLDDDSFKTVIRQITPKNPEFAHAASLVNNNETAALHIIEGTEIIKSNPEFKLKSDDEFNEAFYNKIDINTFGEQSPEWVAGLKDTIKALIASKNKEKGKADREFDNDIFNEAFKEVVGDIATIDIDGTGYFWDKTFKVPTPKNVSAADFEYWYKDIKDGDLDGAYTASGLIVNSYALHEYGSLRIVGDNQYRVYYNNQPVFNEKGEPFILSYTKAKKQSYNSANAEFYREGE